MSSHTVDFGGFVRDSAAKPRQLEESVAFGDTVAMMAMLAHQSLAAELPAINPQFCRDGICFPAVCQADKASSEDTDRVDHVLNQPPGYDYIGFCNLNDDDIAEFLVRGNRSDGDECGSGSFTTCPPAAFSSFTARAQRLTQSSMRSGSSR